MNEELLAKFRKLEGFEQPHFGRHVPQHLDIHLMVWVFLDVHDLRSFRPLFGKGINRDGNLSILIPLLIDDGHDGCCGTD